VPLLVDKNWRWLQGDVVCVLRVKACTCLALQQERRARTGRLSLRRMKVERRSTRRCGRTRTPCAYGFPDGSFLPTASHDVR